MDNSETVVIETNEEPQRVAFRDIVVNEQCRVKYVNMPKCACRAIIRAMEAGKTNRQQDWFVFTFVRHPFVRFMSGYTDKVLKDKMEILIPGCGLGPNTTLDAFIEYILSFKHPERIESHFRPQSIILDERVSHVDFVGKVRFMRKHWKVLMEHGLPPIRHFSAHKSNSRSWKDALDSKAQNRLLQLYKPDFERWPEFEKPV